MRRELQLPIYQPIQEGTHLPEAASRNGLWAVIARVKSRIQRIDSPNMAEYSQLNATSAYSGFSSRQQAGRAR
jgi:hypothetical protein